MTKLFYAESNSYGNATSVGFTNTFCAFAFEGKKQRDEYISKNKHENLALRAISAKQARKLEKCDSYGFRYFWNPVLKMQHRSN